MSNSKTKVNYSRLFGSTFGHISFAAFFIAIISGIILAIFYDVSAGYDSISVMLISNPGASFIRTLHYWSAQFFLVFYILHLRKSTESTVKKAVLLRLSLSLLIVFFVMLSGFILKGDGDALQAKRIVDALLQEIPLIGTFLAYSLLGKNADLQLPYVHHIATTSIFIWIIIAEHAKVLWPKMKTVIYFLPLMILLTFFFPAALKSTIDPVMKGPWYFLGMQEILHQISSIGLVLTLLLLIFLVFYLLPKVPLKFNRILKIVLSASALLYLFLILIGFFFRGENWQWQWPWQISTAETSLLNPLDNFASYFNPYDTSKQVPLIMDQRESCLYCHENVKGFSESHNPKAIGCASCHLGNVFSIEKDLAHSGMIKIPGNLVDAPRTCGQVDCHMGVDTRVKNSIMNTMSGVVSVNRFVFGETDSLNLLHRIDEIENSAADSHLRNLCASCHLGKQKSEYGPIGELSRGGGCNACHLNYSDAALNQLQIINNSLMKDTLNIRFHPSLDLNIRDEHCFGCHSRSGRISTNYQGWHETLLEPTELPADSLHRLLEDGRVFEKVTADIHHIRGLECIDCHNSYEIMGDGNLYAHQEEQLKVQCQDCHFNDQPETIDFENLDFESLKIARLRQMSDTSRIYLATKKDEIPLINTSFKNGKAILFSKNTEKKFKLNPPAEVCTKGNAHDRLSCSSCHTAWAPQCIGCHTEFKRDENGKDNLTGKKTDGAWIEWSGDFLAEAPTLGIIENKHPEQKQETIDVFVPGMILSIDKSAFNDLPDDSLFKRLFAPAKTHTTSLEGRTCKSCHNDPVMLGFGRGKLKYVNQNGKGVWQFDPLYQILKHDNLPADAWIGFLDESTPGQSTRTNMRAFNIEEQKKILQVGACLTCHEDQSNVMQQSLINFEDILKSVSAKCLLLQVSN